MKLSTRNEASGLFHQIKGSTKVMASKINSLGVKGRFERLAGKVQRRIGKTQGLFGL